MEINTGVKGYYETVVTGDHTANALASGLLDVLATPIMVAFMEKAANDSVQPFLDEGYFTVGTEVNISHLSATPVGMKVWTESAVTAVNGRSIDFDVKAFDESGLIGEGTHRRAIVNGDKFMARCYGKKN